MAITTEKRKYTIEDLWELSHHTDKRLELVRGELRELAPESERLATGGRADGVGGGYVQSTGKRASPQSIGAGVR
jgi:hypothetical protein